jgi:hypothetical protein
MEDAAACRALAKKCRALANGVDAPDITKKLLLMAEDYEAQAARLEAEPEPNPGIPHPE